MNKNFFGKASINADILIVLYSVYAIVSLYLYSISTSGFTLLITIVIYAIFYVILWFIAVVGAVIKNSKKINNSTVSKGLLYFLLSVQLLILFLNAGDCGDSPCSTGIDTNSIRHFIFPNITFEFLQVNFILIILSIVYYIFLLIFILEAFYSSVKAKT